MSDPDGDALERAHPAANLFPMLEDDELRTLAADIAANGLHDAVVLHEGLILDGRNRWAACALAGVEPRTEVWASNGASPTDYVISKNLHRRHLTPPQRAAVAVDALPLYAAEARERQRTHGGTAPGRPLETLPANLPEVSGEAREFAAKQFDVSPRYVQEAKRIKQADAGVFERVKAGEMSLRDAQREAGVVVPAPGRRDAITGGELVKMAGAPADPPFLIRPNKDGAARRWEGRYGVPEDVEAAARLILANFDADWVSALVRLLAPGRLPRTNARITAPPGVTQPDRIIGVMKASGATTSDEIGRLARVPQSTVSGRLAELQDAGLVVKTGEKRGRFFVYALAGSAAS